MKKTIITFLLLLPLLPQPSAIALAHPAQATARSAATAQSLTISPAHPLTQHHASPSAHSSRTSPSQPFAIAPAQPASTATSQGINDPKANAILQKVRKNLLTAKSINVDFFYDEKGSKKECNLFTSDINYTLKMPGQQVVCNGKTLWMYDEKTNEVNIYNYQADKDELNPIHSIKNYEKRFRAKYIRSEVFRGKNCDVIDLIPLAGRDYHRIRLYIDSQTLNPSLFEVNLKDGSKYTYVVTSLKKSDTLPKPEDFIFNSKNYPDILENDMR